MEAKPILWTRSFLLMCFINLLMAIAFYFLISILPMYVTTVLNATHGQVGLVLAAYTLSALIIRPFVGYWVDKYGGKFQYLWGLLMFALIFLVYPYMPTVAALLFIRFIHGFIWGSFTTSGSALLVDLIPVQRRGEGIGFFGLSMTLSMAIGPVIGLLILGEGHFTRLFLSGAGFVVISLILALFVKYKPHVSITKALTLRNVFSVPTIPIALNMMFLTMAYGGMMSFITLYSKELGVSQPGTFFTYLAVGILVSRLFSGRIFDRKGPRIIGVISFVLLTFGFLFLGFFRDYYGFLISGFIIGTGFGMSMPTLQTMANNVVDRTMRGAANSTFFTGFDLGIGLGAILMGLGSDHLGFQKSFYLSGLLCLIAGVYFVVYILGHYNKSKI